MVQKTSRRTILSLLGASATVGLAGCTSSSDDDDEPSENTNATAPDTDDTDADADAGTDDTQSDRLGADSDVLESIDAEGQDLTFTVAEDVDGRIDRVQLFDPEGESFDTAYVSAGETESIRLLVMAGGLYHRGYTPGEHTVRVFSFDGVLEERTIELEPDLRLVDFEMEDAVRNERHLRPVIENVGTGPAYVDEGTFESEHIGSTNGFATWDDHLIGANESKTLEEESVGFPHYDESEEYGTYCTGSGAFDVELSVTVEERHLGTLSGDVNVAARGERVDSYGSYTCSEAEVNGLPVDLA